MSNNWEAQPLFPCRQLPTATEGHTTMERVIRPKKRSRNLAIVSLIFFVSVGIASVCVMWFSALPDRRIYAAVFMAMFWGCWASLSCWLLLAYWREELRIVDGQITQRGVIGVKEINLRSLTAVRWRIAPQGGSLVLTTATGKARIYLDNFEPEVRVWLIRYFRNEVSEVLQDGWALFCHKIAVPLRDRNAISLATPGPGNVRITRRRWDWYFIPLIVLCAVLGIVLSWQFQQPQAIVFPVLPAVLWLCIRGMTPRNGFVAERVTSRPEVVGYLVFLACWLGVAIAGVVLFGMWSPPSPAAAIIGISALALWYAVLFWRSYQLDRVRRKRDETNAVASIRRWSEEEAAGKKVSVDEPTSYA